MQFDFGLRRKNHFAQDFHDQVLLGRELRATPFLGLGKETIKIPFAAFAFGDALKGRFHFALDRGPLRRLSRT